MNHNPLCVRAYSHLNDNQCECEISLTFGTIFRGRFAEITQNQYF